LVKTGIPLSSVRLQKCNRCKIGLLRCTHCPCVRFDSPAFPFQLWPSQSNTPC